MRYDTVVIGAGLSGLAAGIRLAQFERPVAVLERHDVWGGLNSFYSLGGRRFDVGLHALTNWAPPGARGAPLSKLLRQLRLRHADLRLREQRSSQVLFPSARLSFTNDFGHLEAEVERVFPASRDDFAALVRAVRGFDLGRDDGTATSARAVLADVLREPLLAEMLLLPICFYGSAREDDVDWHTFVVLFRSMFLEGLCRPEGGIRTLLNLLVKRYRSLGGELRLSTGVRRILVEDGAVRGLELDDGTSLEAERVLSSAGWVETMRLCGAPVAPAEVGRLSFVESISVLDRPAAELGLETSTCFFSAADRLVYRVPEELGDVGSGVISVPDNFQLERPAKEGLVRLTSLANHACWAALPPAEYAAAKARLAEGAIESAARFVPDWRPATVFRDVFTPLTIQRFTGHVNGAVYGSPRKRLSGATGIAGLHLCGTDQGYLGVVGAMLSGILMANQHSLVGA